VHPRGAEEGNAAFANAFEGASLRVPRERIPHAIFTDPEGGSVGSTEAEARRQGIEVAAMTISAHQVTRAFLSGREAGLLKFIVDARSHAIAGCHVIAHDGAELIYDVALVMALGGTIDDLGHVTGVFPTMQE